MARPTDRFARVDAAGEIARDRGEFWVQSPWNYPPHQNLSAYEPNRVLLNHGGWQFLDATLVSGAGITADGRAALVADLDGDLQPDLIVRSAGGGPLRFFRNTSKAHRLTVSLHGTKSNRLGLGARVVAEVGGRRLTREVWSHNNFAGQQAPRARFGLGDQTSVDRLTIHWPSGRVQVLEDVRADQHLTVKEK